MSLIPIDSTHIQVAIQNDAQQIRQTLSWLQQRDSAYQLNMTTTNMTTAGISAGDQTAILAFIADIHRLMLHMQGTVQTIAGDMRVSTAGVLGIT